MNENEKPIAAFRVKLKNRRVIGCRFENGDTGWTFKRLDGKTVKETHIRLSHEAFIAMVEIFADLEKGEKQ